MDNNRDHDFLQELLSSQTSASWDSTTSFSKQIVHNNVINGNVWRTTTPHNFSDNTNNTLFPIISSSSFSWDPSVDHPQSFTTNHLSTFNQVFHSPTTTTFSTQPPLHFTSSDPRMMEDDQTASFLVQQDDYYSNPFLRLEDHHQVLNSSLMEEDHANDMMMMFLHNDNQSLKMEKAIGTSELVPLPSVFNVGCGVKAGKNVQGQPSKNLMAERRRRKRLNDRLSMLRSIVPKISKMDRTSIVGDTIDYMKELLERIQRLQEELGVESSDDLVQLLDCLFKDLKPNNEVQIRNTPKFEVERKSIKDTRIEIRCNLGKPGLLLSTVNTMEALGLEIEQCVVSCFNEFEMHASCSKDIDHIDKRDCEEIKEALFRNAGYEGRCL